MEITSKTRLCGLVGYPVSHSLSPLMQNAAFSYYKIDAAYLTFSVLPQNLKYAIKGLTKAGALGLNVTIPHKEAALALVEDADAASREIGAINTIQIKNGRSFGFNTDAPGFLRSMKEDLKLDPKGKAALVLGAGGAGRAVSYALAKAGARFIVVYDVAFDKAKRLAKRMEGIFRKANVCAVSDLSKVGLKKFDLLVNASPVGMKGGSPLDVSLLHRRLAVYDMVYNRKTELVEAAKRRGAKAANGLGMLLHQGALSFSIWTGKKPPLAIMRRALLAGIKRAR